MASFHLEILTPERVFYRGECISLIVPITDGMLGIMAHREPITASITYGEAYYTKPDGEKILFSVSGGMIDVIDNTVTLLCSSALLPEEIDEETERREAEKARSEMVQQHAYRDYQLSKILLANAINNLKVKQKQSIN
ncbi:MAG: F0F1 ATP synthase subunit epsilon [Ruminococcaceae bacterium]|nr:F0F1 ATP synthase subunit epsilon [Oscillospiraceae bacterium]